MTIYGKNKFICPDRPRQTCICLDRPDRAYLCPEFPVLKIKYNETFVCSKHLCPDFRAFMSRLIAIIIQIKNRKHFGNASFQVQIS